MTDSSSGNSQFWLNTVIDEVEAAYPSGDIVISSGISPSASYHIGHFREIISSDLVRWGLQQRGRSVRHIHVVDNFDPLRKRYDFLPSEYEKYVGWPICLVPDPHDCHPSYAEHFFQDFYQWVKKLQIEAEVIRSYEDLYATGRMAPYIATAIEKVEMIKEIFARLSNRQLEEDWVPVQILSDNNSFNNWKFERLLADEKKIEYHDESQNKGTVRYDEGRVKLNWRLDWPARWAELGVMVEPHGYQEHGAAGGSYETGLAFAENVFNVKGPIAGMQYAHVHLTGDNKKMSSSKGNLITPEQAFAIMPPEMLRYFYARYQAKKRIDFDPGIGLYRMYDEFAAVDKAFKQHEDHEFMEAYGYAIDGLPSLGVSSVPFSHLVTVYQTAEGDKDEINNILRRSGHGEAVEQEQPALTRQLVYVENWLRLWAPDEVVFELQKQLPPVDLSDKQKKLLAQLASAMESTDNPNGEWYHAAIYKALEEVGISAKEAFEAIYKILLAKNYGPKAGWYLSLLDTSWLKQRLLDGAKA